MQLELLNLDTKFKFPIALTNFPKSFCLRKFVDYGVEKESSFAQATMKYF